MKQHHCEQACPAGLSGIAILLVVVTAAVGACAPSRLGGAVEPDRVIHQLRREKIALRNKIEDLEHQAKLRLDQIDKLEQQLKSGIISDGTVAAVDLPRMVAIRFGRYSGPLDTNADSRDDLIRLYVQTLDQRGRFLPVAGSAEVQVVSIQAGQDPVMFAQQSLLGVQWDKTYHSSFMGTHYRLEVPLPLTWTGTSQIVTIKLTLTDAATGGVVSHEQPMQIRDGMRGGGLRDAVAPVNNQESG